MKIMPVVQFKGIIQQREYEKIIRQFPSKSLEKLTEINAQRDFKSHVALSEHYSKTDEHVRFVHEEVAKLVAQKKSAPDEGILAQVKEKLSDLRQAIQVVLDQFNQVD